MYLAGVRQRYEHVLTAWNRWRDVDKAIEDEFGLHVTHIAWANLAKCRLAIDGNANPVAALCRRQFPIAQTVQVLRRVVVLSCVLNARLGGGLVGTWRPASVDPWVWT